MISPTISRPYLFWMFMIKRWGSSKVFEWSPRKSKTASFDKICDIIWNNNTACLKKHFLYTNLLWIFCKFFAIWKIWYVFYQFFFSDPTADPYVSHINFLLIISKQFRQLTALLSVFSCELPIHLTHLLDPPLSQLTVRLNFKEC